MKFNTKDTYILFFILVFIAEGIAYFRLNELEKVTKQLIDANHTLYEIYRIDRRLNALDELEQDVGDFLKGSLEEEIYPIYPKKKGT